jgi:hypothetical protein
MNFVSNIIWNSVEGFVEAGTRTAGGYAGDALIKAGDLIENGGRSVGNGTYSLSLRQCFTLNPFAPFSHLLCLSSEA